MKITVACDICGHRYQANEQRLGSNQKCQYCETTFELTEAPEIDENEADPDAVSPFWQVIQRIGQGMTAVVIVGILSLMVSLLFTDPRVSTAGVRRSSNQRWTNSNARPQRQNQKVQTPSPATAPKIPSVYKMPDFPGGVSIPNLEPSVPKFQNSIPEIPHAPQTPFLPPAKLPMRPDVKLPTPLPPPLVPIQNPFRPVPNSRSGTRTPFAPTAAQAPKTSNFKSPSNKLNYNGPSSISPSGRTVQSVQQLKPGQLILVQWGSSWFPSDVLRISGNRVKIHYRGWSENWDEEVPLSKIQLPHKEYEDSK